MLADITSNFYSLIVGALFMLTVYHLLLYIQHRKTNYLLYSIYMLCLAMYVFGTNFQHYFGRQLTNFNGTFLFVGIGMYLQLARSIVETATYMPKIDHLINKASYIICTIGLLFPIVPLVFGYQIFIHVYDVLAVLLALVSIYFYFHLFSVKTIYARYFLTGSLFYFVCSMIVLFGGIFIGSKNFRTIFGFEILFISYLGTLIEAIIFALLIGYRNKEVETLKVLAEKNVKIEQQNINLILKEQELTTIDAMIAGQEKERQRLAGDLHDSVGATLAAAKLQFHHLSINREKGAITEELFDKTGTLLEDAYNEIRTMAHVKNSGVIAKNGLLPAVQKLARNASAANGLIIEVEDYGLEDRLDNVLEITIFRIIQELITNIIKHAQASEASIAINKYKDTINIIIQDNGQGFDARHLPEKDGMGLSSIEKRIEHLEGTMEIDSTPRKGTHILIDIPL